MKKTIGLVLVMSGLFCTTHADTVKSVTYVETLINEQKYDEAKTELEKIVKQYPESEKANSYLYQVLKIQKSTDANLIAYNAKAQELKALRVAKEEKIAAEQRAKTKAALFKAFVYFLIMMALAGIGYILYRQYQVKKSIRDKATKDQLLIERRAKRTLELLERSNNSKQDFDDFVLLLQTKPAAYKNVKNDIDEIEQTYTDAIEILYKNGDYEDHDIVNFLREVDRFIDTVKSEQGL